MILIAPPPMSGKTWVSRMFGCGSYKDIIKCCALFGSNNKSMAYKGEALSHNYLPLLQNMNLLKYELADAESRKSVLRLIHLGSFFSFQNGSYIQANCLDIFTSEDAVILYCFNEKAEATVIPSAAMIVFCVDPKTTHITALVRAEWLCYSDEATIFDLVPNITIGEGAPGAPRNWKYLKSKTPDVSSQDAIFLNIIRKRIAAGVENTFLNDPSIRDKFQEEVKRRGINVMSFITEYPSFFPDHVNDYAKLLLTCISKGYTQSEIDFANVTSSTTIWYPTDLGLRQVELPALMILMRMERCFIDSIQSLVFTGEGSATSQGLTTDVLDVFASTNHCENFAMYALISEDMNKDPIASKKLDGQTCGLLYLKHWDPSVKPFGCLINRDIAFSTRNPAVSNRSKLVSLVKKTTIDANGQRSSRAHWHVFGKRKVGVIHRDDNNMIIKEPVDYRTLGYTDCYDKQLQFPASTDWCECNQIGRQEGRKEINWVDDMFLLDIDGEPETVPVVDLTKQLYGT